MKILALIDLKPFDGTPAFTCLRIDHNGHLFDLPIDDEQLHIIRANTQVEHEDEEVEEHFLVNTPQDTPPQESPQFKPSHIKNPYEDDDDEVVMVNGAPFAMGQSFSDWGEDDEL